MFHEMMIVVSRDLVSLLVIGTTKEGYTTYLGRFDKSRYMLHCYHIICAIVGIYRSNLCVLSALCSNLTCRA